jgi:hypothetical protein
VTSFEYGVLLKGSQYLRFPDGQRSGVDVGVGDATVVGVGAAVGAVVGVAVDTVAAAFFCVVMVFLLVGPACANDAGRKIAIAIATVSIRIMRAALGRRCDWTPSVSAARS